MSATWTNQAAAEQPNFVVLFADDLGFGDVGSYGATDIATPYIDELASGGVRFTTFYSASPVCSPSRAALLTGKYPERAGVPANVGNGIHDGLPPTQITLAEALAPSGYTSALIGKWHLGRFKGRRPQDQGFDHFFGFLGGVIDHWSHTNYWNEDRWQIGHDLWENDNEVFRPGQSMTQLITEETLTFLDANHQRPFFLFVSFNAPHWPIQPAREYLERNMHLASPRREYAALVSQLDDAVGKIVHRVNELQIRNRTLILFLSDNGPSVEQPANFGGGSAGQFRGHKKSIFEGGIRAPLIANWPGKIPQGISQGVPVIVMDLFPTLTRLAGVELPNDIDGVDIWPLMDGSQSDLTERPLIFKWQNQQAVRLGKWKLVRNPRLHDGSGVSLPVEALYDLVADPGETTDLSQENPQLAVQLRQLLDSR